MLHIPKKFLMHAVESVFIKAAPSTKIVEASGLVPVVAILASRIEAS